MADTNIKISQVTIMPNPCKTGEQITLSVGIEDIIFGLISTNGELLLTGNQEAIEYCEGQVNVLLTADNEAVLTDDDRIVEYN